MLSLLLTLTTKVNRSAHQNNNVLVTKEFRMNTDLIQGAMNAAAFTGLSRRKIYQLVEQGHVPSIRKGRRLYFRKSELDVAFRATEAVRGPLQRSHA